MVLVSVLMPMRNAEPYVKKALASILCDTSTPLEIIVVDDGSTDKSRTFVEGVRDPRVKLIDGPQRGIAKAFNAAAEACSGDIIMRCDADDIYAKGRIARQVGWLGDHPEFGAVCGAFSAIGAGWRSILKAPLLCAGSEAKEVTDDLRAGKVETHFNTFAIRRDTLQWVPARSFFVTAEDADLQLRIGEQCRVWYSPEEAYNWRIVGNSVTHTASGASKDYYEAKAREFQKQRQTRGWDDLQKGIPANAILEVDGVL